MPKATHTMSEVKVEAVGLVDVPQNGAPFVIVKADAAKDGEQATLDLDGKVTPVAKAEDCPADTTEKAKPAAEPDGEDDPDTETMGKALLAAVQKVGKKMAGARLAALKTHLKGITDICKELDPSMDDGAVAMQKAASDLEVAHKALSDKDAELVATKTELATVLKTATEQAVLLKAAQSTVAASGQIPQDPLKSAEQEKHVWPTRITKAASRGKDEKKPTGARVR